MYLKRFFVEGLAHASYLFGADGEAAVVDPKRDVDDYLAEAERKGCASSRFSTAIRTPISPPAFANWPSEPARKSTFRISPRQNTSTSPQKTEIGSSSAHSRSSSSKRPAIRRTAFLSWSVKMPEPLAIFTGDLLFVNDVGRPDLRDADEDPSALAGKMYDSLFQKILPLPDEVKVYPAHGAGSLCGRAISDAPFSLVGQERKLNWALQISDRHEFVRQMTANLPDRPAYFSYDVGVNLNGAAPLGSLPPLQKLGENEFD